MAPDSRPDRSPERSVSRIFCRSSGIVKTVRIFSNMIRSVSSRRRPYRPKKQSKTWRRCFPPWMLTTAYFLLRRALLGFFHDRGRHRQHDRLGAGLLDFFQGRLAELVGGDFQFLRELAVAEHLQEIIPLFDHSPRPQNLGRDLVSAGKDGFQAAQIDGGDDRATAIVKTALGNPPHQRHPGAFEDGMG